LQNKPKEVLSGTGVPSNLKGQNGNLYVDKDAKEIYLKENGKWI